MELAKAGLSSIAGIGKAAGSAAGTAAGSVGNFSDVLKGFVNGAISDQKAAEGLTVAAASGDNVALHQVVQAVTQAELTLQTLVAVRDKAVEAYQQIMQMPV